MKDIERRVIVELIKNCRSSDREIAKAIGVSQPTVSRVRQRAEKKGLIRYTAIPDPVLSGFEIMAVVFGKRNLERQPFSIQKGREFAVKHPQVILAATGNGLGFDRIVISMHKDFSDYSDYMREFRAEWGSGMDEIDAFLVGLRDKGIAMPLSFRGFAEALKSEAE